MHHLMYIWFLYVFFFSPCLHEHVDCLWGLTYVIHIPCSSHNCQGSVLNELICSCLGLCTSCEIFMYYVFLFFCSGWKPWEQCDSQCGDHCEACARYSTQVDVCSEPVHPGKCTNRKFSPLLIISAFLFIIFTSRDKLDTPWPTEKCEDHS